MEEKEVEERQDITPVSDKENETDAKEKAEYYRRRKMSYSIRLLCALYLSYLVYSLITGLDEAQGTERIIVIVFIVFFAVFDVFCYISGIKGLNELKKKND